MANGTFYGDPKFDLALDSTKRLITAAKNTDAHWITVTLALSPKTAGGLAFNPFKVGDRVIVTNVADWANVSAFDIQTMPDSPGYVGAVSSNTITYRKYNFYTHSILTSLNAQVERRQNNTMLSSIPETRTLSTMFKYNTDLTTSTTKMCNLQVRVKDIITNFWKDPEVIRNYNRLYAKYKTNWYGYGPQGGYNLTKFVNATMCILYGTSNWQKQCVNGLDGTCNDWTTFTLSQLDDANMGLWQIIPSGVTSDADWAILPSDLPYGVIDVPQTWLNAEYSTRAALWLMYRRLNYELTGTFGFTSETCNPFRWMDKAGWNTATLRWLDSKVQTCWGSGCSACPPYGSATCL